MGQTISVNGAESLEDALSTAAAGTTIKLAPGDYGRLAINAIYGSPWGKFAGEVTIRSADPNNPATFSDIFLRGVENLTIDGVAIDYKTPSGMTGAAALNYNSAVLVQEGANVTIRNSLFDGDVHNGPGTLMHGLPVAQALVVRESDGIAIEDNEFLRWRGAGYFQNSSDVVISGNDMHTLRSEGLNFVAVQDVVIEDNHFHDFVSRAGVTDHRDMIQFWTHGARTPSTDIAIRDNFFDSGSGVWTQTILMTLDAGGPAMMYRNLVIENNVIYNGHYHGITVGTADGLTIRNNTVLHNRDAGDSGPVSRPSINVADDARNVLVTKNISHNVPDANAKSVGWRVADNLLVQNTAASKPNYYGDLFENSLAGDAADLAGLKGLPGSVVELQGYGSTLPSQGEWPEPAPGGTPPAQSPEPAPEPVEPPPAQSPEPEPAPAPGDLSFVLALAHEDGRVVDGNLTDGEVLALDAIDDGRVTMVATPSQAVGSIRMNLVGVYERVEEAAPYVLYGDRDGDFLPGRPLGAGDYEMVLTAYSGSSGDGSVLGSRTVSFSVADQPGSAPSPSPEAGVVYRWNAGTSTVEAVDGGPDWAADRGAVVGSAALAAGPAAASWTLDESVPEAALVGLFAQEYYGTSKTSPMGLEFGDGTLEDGRYAVRLYMGNGWSGTDSPGERVFDVRVEDELFRDDLDLSATLGHRVGGMLEWKGTVDDGTVDIDFLHGVENPLINGVEIIRLEDELIL